MRQSCARRLPFAAIVLLASLLVARTVGAAGTAALVNGSFEETSGGLPAGWSLDAAVKAKGEVRVVDHPSGGRALLLLPNARNGGDKPLGVGQLLDATAFRGKQITVQAVLAADGGAEAVVGVHVLGASGGSPYVHLVQGDSNGTLIEQHKTLDVPTSAENLVVFAIVTSGTGRAWFKSIALAPSVPPGTAASSAASPGAAVPATTERADIRVDVARVIRPVPPALFGTNVEWIWNGQGLWSDKLGMLDPDALRQVRELGPTVIRFPGGVFSDAYHWRDGLGPQDKRPTTDHYPKGPRSTHHFGNPELVAVAQTTGSELLLTVNAGSGTAEEAAEWVKFMNHGPGGMRVTRWEVGNELYMKGDLSGGQMSAERYASTYLAFASAMRAVDPTIRVGAIGGLNQGAYHFIDDARWSEKLLKAAAGQIDFLAVHDAYAPVVIGIGAGTDPRSVYRAMLAAPLQIEQNLRALSELLARYEMPGRPIGIAVTEWGPLFHVMPDSPWVDHVKTMGSALFVASTMNVFLRNPRVEMTNFFKLTDAGFMGWIGRRDGRWEPTPAGIVFSEYRHQLAGNVVQAEVDGPVRPSAAVGVVAAFERVPQVDAVAVAEGDNVKVIVTNKSDSNNVETRVSLAGIKSYAGAEISIISADSFDANTGTELPQIPGLNWARQIDLGRFSKGGPQDIHRTTKRLAATGTTVMLVLPPISVTTLVVSGVRR